MIINEACSKKGVLVVRPEGDLSDSNSDDLYAYLNQRISQGSREMVLDLSEIEFMDTTAIGYLVAVLKNIRQLGGDMELKGLNRQPLRVFKTLNLADFFNIRDVETAVC